MRSRAHLQNDGRTHELSHIPANGHGGLLDALAEARNQLVKLADLRCELIVVGTGTRAAGGGSRSGSRRCTGRNTSAALELCNARLQAVQNGPQLSEGASHPVS